MTFYKLWTHDFCSPLQGGKSVWDGSLPFTLPTVKLDTGTEECSHGWNFVDDLAKGFQIAGMWPNGRPSCVSIIEPSEDAIQRGEKWRSSSGKIVRFATEVEVAQGIEQFSKVFNGFESEMANEQIAWRYALGRPENNEAAVMEGLEKALAHRGLKWTVKKYGDTWDARAAWDTWDARAARDTCDAWAARAAWDTCDAWAARAAWDTCDAWAARAAWDTCDAWAARAARDACDAWAARAARDTCDAWAARAAWDALIVYFSSKKGWTKDPADLLTLGLREAYANGLEIALPAGKDQLGFAMKERP